MNPEHLTNKNQMSSQVIISTEGGMQTIGEAITQKRDLDDGYTYYLESNVLDNVEFHKFIEELQIEHKLDAYDFSINSSKSFVYQNSDIKIYMNSSSKRTIFDVLTTTQELSEKIFKLFRKRVKVNSEIGVHFNEFFYNNNKVDSKMKYYNIKDFESTTDLYYPYIDTDVMFEQLLTQQESILVLLGKPGIGKTKLSNVLLKYMMSNPDKIPYNKPEIYDLEEEENFISVCYVKNPDILAEDTFWRTLENSVYDIVLLDDLDYFLVSRDKSVQSQEDVNRNKFISQLLSYTDGVQKNKTKFIITSNRTSEDTDSAILRKGRLFDILELTDLSKEESRVIWEHYELDSEEFNELFKSDVILPADLGSEIAKRKSDSSVILENYLKRPGISKKVVKNKKVGF